MDHCIRALCCIGVLACCLSGAGFALAADSEGPVGYVIIPAIGLYYPVYSVPIVDHAYSEAALAHRVGWLEGTSWIHDGWGRVVLAGHSYGVFTGLTQISQGDRVIVGDSGGAVEYFITTWQIVSVYDTSWLYATEKNTLLLITCEGDQRRVIQAERKT